MLRASIEESRQWYLHLYGHLSELHDVFMNASIPPSFEAPGCFEVNAVLLLIEDIVKKLPEPPSQPIA